MKVYLDNAATTPIAKEVIKEIEPYLYNHFGNPSSTHSFGRKTKNAIEINRKKIADFINAENSEIIFTSGGTEADNMAMRCAVNDLNVRRIITSKIEHHAVGHTAECLKDSHDIEVIYLSTDKFGNPSIIELKEYLKNNVKTLVSLMHANNEIGTILPLEEVSLLCNKNDHVFFHSDTVQTMGHYLFDVKKLKIDFLVCSAHKFHGPKGIGFLYVNKNLPLNPIITGGSQERNHRGGTENLYGIIGLGKAMELAFSDLENHQKHIQSLKDYLRTELIKIDSRIKFNGDPSSNSLYTVLSVRFPKNVCNSMLLFSLDIHGIASSGGSACSSGSNKGSHVLAELPDQMEYQSVRFSFSRYNNKKEVDFTLDKIRSIMSNGK